jgi:hypothetical protein
MIDATFAALADVADHSYLLALPDRTLDGDPQLYGLRWDRFRQAMQEAAARHPNVELIDLTRGGARAWNDFRDGVHVHRRGLRRQRARFVRELKKLGVPVR